jgi:hypothetical protein
LISSALKSKANQFLTNIRETDAIVHVVRAFDNDDIIHVSGKVSPFDDIEIINFCPTDQIIKQNYKIGFKKKILLFSKLISFLKLVYST